MRNKIFATLMVLTLILAMIFMFGVIAYADTNIVVAGNTASPVYQKVIDTGLVSVKVDAAVELLNLNYVKYRNLGNVVYINNFQVGCLNYILGKTLHVDPGRVINV